MGGRSYRFSASQIQNYLECRQKYYLTRVAKVGPNKRSTALDFGWAMDRAVRVLYASGFDLKLAEAEFQASYTEDPQDTKRTVEVGRTILKRYHTAYEGQDARMIDQGFCFLLSVPELPGVTIAGEIDRVFEKGGRVLPVEFKTTSQLTADYMKKFWWDMQTIIYHIAARQLIDPKISAVLIDAALVAKSDPSKLRSSPLLRDIVERDTAELEYARQRILQIMSDMVVALDAFEAGQDLFYENDQACVNYGGCQYLSYCRRSPAVRQSIWRSDFVSLEADEKEMARFDNAKRGEFRL